MATTTTTNTQTDELTHRLYAALGIQSTGSRSAKGWALARLKALDMANTCSRCCGTGLYGPTCVEGGRCFNCLGVGVSLPKPTEALVAKAAQAVAAGKLEPYLQRLRLLRNANTATDRAMGIWKATGVSGMYSWNRAADATRAAAEGKLTHTLAYHRQVADENARLAARYDVVSNLASTLRCTQEADAQEEVAHAIAAAMEAMQAVADLVVAELAKLHQQYPGELEQHQAEEAEREAKYRARMAW